MIKNVPWHILAPRRGCFGNHLPLRRVRILAERFCMIGRISYHTEKAACILFYACGKYQIIFFFGYQIGFYFSSTSIAACT